MTQPMRPAVDPVGGPAPVGYVTNVDYVLSLLSERNVHFDAEVLAVATALDLLRETTTKNTDLLRAATGHDMVEMERRHELRISMEREAWQQVTAAIQKGITSALQAAERNADKADLANEKRFDSVNEFRAQLRDQVATFIPRVEADQRLGQLGVRIDELRNSDAVRTGRSAGSNALYVWIVGGIGALATLLAIANSVLR